MSLTGRLEIQGSKYTRIRSMVVMGLLGLLPFILFASLGAVGANRMFFVLGLALGAALAAVEIRSAEESITVLKEADLQGPSLSGSSALHLIGFPRWHTLRRLLTGVGLVAVTALFSGDWNTWLDFMAAMLVGLHVVLVPVVLWYERKNLCRLLVKDPEQVEQAVMVIAIGVLAGLVYLIFGFD